MRIVGWLVMSDLFLATIGFAGGPGSLDEMQYPNIVAPVAEFGEYGKDPGQLIDPLGAAIRADGRLFVSDSGNNRIQVFTTDGRWIGGWGRTGSRPGEFLSPTRMAWVDAALYVADTGNHRIQVFAEDGTLLSTWGKYGSSSGQFKSPQGLSVVGNHVLVADTQNHRVQAFDRTGNFLFEFGTYGAAPRRAQ